MGSIVCYLTGLSHVDPVENGLFLGRFLNRDMASVPDIDLDFPRDVRELLIEEVIARYGAEHAALVAAFPTFRIRMAIRELGGALALPEADLERLTRLSDAWSSARAVEEELARLPDGEAKLASPRWRALAVLAREAAGLPRHLSQHSGGMVVSARPLVELVPVVPAAFPGRQICQWDKDSCADAGFVKIDLLGLGMLSAVEECIDLIARSRGESVDLSRIGLTDPAVYAEIQDADTVGVFQIESRAQMQSLLQTRPENLEDLTIQVALIRPGPVSGGAVHPYVKHRRALRADPAFEPPYDHPLLADCLRETLGVVVFQEQVLEVAMALAGFTPGQAEALRRAMSRKRSREAMVALWKEFRDGARDRGVDDETIRTVFRKLIGFSNFGFPKAHSSAFAVLAYQSAWLRQRYPAEFLASLMNAQPMGFYPPATPRPRRPAPRRAGAAAVRRALRRDLRDRGRRRAGRPRLRARGARGGRRPPGGRAGGERPLPRHRRPRRPRRPAPRAARPAREVRRLRRPGAPAAGDALGARRARAPAQRGGRRPQLALPIPAAQAPPLPELGRFERTLDRLRDDGPVHRLAPRRRSCGPGCRAGSSRPPSCARPPTAATSSSPGSWWPASAPPPPAASSSCCSRTRPGWSTASCARRSTSATAPSCAADPLVVVHGPARAARAQHERAGPPLERIDPPAEGADGPRRRGRDGPRPRRRPRGPELRPGPALATGAPPRGDWRRGVRRPPAR